MSNELKPNEWIKKARVVIFDYMDMHKRDVACDPDYVVSEKGRERMHKRAKDLMYPAQTKKEKTDED